MKLSKTTATSELDYDKYRDSHKFFGNISENSFEIQAMPSTRTRKLFNLLILGIFCDSKLSIEMKLTPFDYIFIALYFIVCVLFGVLTYVHSLENEALFPFVFILPTIIFLTITLIFSFFAKTNYSDALYNIEKIINKSN